MPVYLVEVAIQPETTFETFETEADSYAEALVIAEQEAIERYELQGAYVDDVWSEVVEVLDEE